MMKSYGLDKTFLFFSDAPASNGMLGAVDDSRS
jgi:hypothetical protein